MQRFVYADNSATTKLSDAVYEAMLPYIKDNYGNASSIYSIGRDSSIAIEAAREQVANALGALPAEVFFTSGGTESDNWAIKPFAQPARKTGQNHIITSTRAHAVLHTVQTLEKEGFEITYLPVDRGGIINPEQVRGALRDTTALVSIMYANNEIGTIQPISEIGAICRENGVLFHTDAVQAIGNVAINVKEQNIDLLSLSGHKIHAPKGIGALYCRRGIVLPNFMDGGAQERGKRGGTENVAAIVALGKAMEIAAQDISKRAAKIRALRDRLIEGVMKIPRTHLNGDREKRLATNANFSFEGVEGEGLLLMLDLQGVCASSG
ncbi:MAG: cysteine desulfurase family protein, partial [Oscillospiraceae bacterium]